jgi:hypothetical protein
MKLEFDIARSHQPEPGHNDSHPMMVSINGALPVSSKVAPRDLGNLTSVGFSESKITKTIENLVKRGTATLEDDRINEERVRRFFFEAA